jgi:hypothetical protein
LAHSAADSSEGLATATSARESSGSIDDFVVHEMPNSGAPGLAYAVIEDGETASGATERFSSAAADL